MNKYYLSANQFAEFANGTLATKKRIIKQQIIPNKFLVPWYQTARGAMKRYFKNIDNLTPLDEAIGLLTRKEKGTKRQEIDKKVSIEALNELKEFVFPKLLRNLEFEIVKPLEKVVEINNVNIIVAPDVVLKGTFNNKTIYGAIKVHICKSKPFDQKQSQYVANFIHKFLIKKVQTKNSIILPELCICLDIFGGRITTALKTSTKDNLEVKGICEEIKVLWAA